MLARPAVYLTWWSIKMWSRDRAAMFWTFFLPLVIMVIFGLLNFGELGKVDLGIVDKAGNEASQRFIAEAEAVAALRVNAGTEESERAALADGKRDLVIILPANFGPSSGDQGILWEPTTVQALYHGSRPGESQVGLSILQSGIDDMNFAISGSERVVTLTKEAVAARDLGYIDFLMPGVIGMAIMQLGLFSVAFSFVTMKREGVLRRLLATPLDPTSLLIAQVITRLIVVLIQTVILAAVAVFLFGAEFAGSFLRGAPGRRHGRGGVPGHGVCRVRLGAHRAAGGAPGEHRIAAHDVLVRCILFPGRAAGYSAADHRFLAADLSGRGHPRHDR